MWEDGSNVLFTWCLVSEMSRLQSCSRFSLFFWVGFTDVYDLSIDLFFVIVLWQPHMPRICMIVTTCNMNQEQLVRRHENDCHCQPYRIYQLMTVNRWKAKLSYLGSGASGIPMQLVNKGLKAFLFRGKSSFKFGSGAKHFLQIYCSET